MDFFVKSKSKERYERIRLCDVVYIETGGNSNIIIHTEQGSYKFSTSLSRFQSQHNSRSLVKLHQSYISDSQCSLKLLNNGVFTTFRR
jgi:DNA-binding LytR/AlgR family response regulator